MERKALSRDEVCVKFFDKRSNEKFEFPSVKFHLCFNERSDFFSTRINKLVKRGMIKSWIENGIRYYASTNYID